MSYSKLLRMLLKNRHICVLGTWKVYGLRNYTENEGFIGLDYTQL